MSMFESFLDAVTLRYIDLEGVTLQYIYLAVVKLQYIDLVVVTLNIFNTTCIRLHSVCACLSDPLQTKILKLHD